MEEGTELGQYPVVSVRRDGATEEVYGRAELYTCIPVASPKSCSTRSPPRC